MREEFDRLDQGSMNIVEYKACFHTVSKYSGTSISIESEQIWKFMKGFYGTYQLATAQMVVLGATFQNIIEHAKMNESIIQATQGGTKRCIVMVSLVDMYPKVDTFLVKVP